MSFIYSTILLSLVIMAILGLGKILTKKKSLFYSIVVLLGVATWVYYNSFPAIAATDLAALGANESTLPQEQQQIEEDLKVTPGGKHYSGIEYTERTQKAENPVSDDSIKESIKAYTSDNVVVAVANGSVRFSGRVKDKETAQDIIEQTKAIPGVFEITFNLGLNNPAS